MVDKIHFSSEVHDYETPDFLYEFYNQKYNFNVDVAAHAGNAKHINFIDESKDLFSTSLEWQVGWMNPPYRIPEEACKKTCKKKRCEKRGWHTDKHIPGQLDFVDYVYNQVINNHATMVCLLPARPDTEIFHNYVMKASFVDFVRGRLIFKGAKDPAPFPSMVVIFDQAIKFPEIREQLRFPIFRTLNVDSEKGKCWYE